MTSGNVVGTVKDPAGAAIPNAAVSVRSQATGVTVRVVANAQGQYRAENLLPGLYDVTSSASGFATTTVKGVTVTINTSATRDVAMGVGSSTASVEVDTDSGVALDTTTQNLTTTFEPEELATLPVASTGEGVLNTSLLAPGVGSTGGIGIGVGPSIGGKRPRNNNFTIEGIDNNNKSVTGPLVYVPNDAVGEFTLITTQFSPEFGHSSGGQFNTNVLSGTNKFHGKLYEYFRNRNLDAAEVSEGVKQSAVPRYDFNRYGGQIGGPVLKDKLFFFVNYERNTIGQNESYNICTPTAAGLQMIQGLSTVAGFSQNNITQYLKYTQAATNLASDATLNACGAAALNISSGHADASGNNTGTSQATIPVGSLPINSPYFTNMDTLTTSADYTMSSKDSFRLRYVYNTEGTTDIAANLPTFWQSTPYKYHLVALSEYHNFTPNLINEARIGFNRFENTINSGNYSYPGLDQFPNLQFFDQGYLQYGPDPNAPQFTIQNLYQITDNVHYTHGRHTMAFGFDGRKYISPQGFTQRARGDYEYSLLSDFLHDYAPDANGVGERSTGNQTYYGDQTQLYGYANDTWRATDKLTLNFGVRYEFTSVPVGERAQALNSGASTSVLTIGAPQPSYVSWAPRLGIEYAPDNKTSIRFGYGIAYDTLFDNLGTLSFPPQYSSTQDVGQASSSVNYGDPNFLANGGLPPGNGSGVTVLSPADAIAATSAFVPNQVVPYSENYTLTIEREISKGVTAMIGYVGNRGIHLPVQDQLNIQPRTTTANYLPTFVNGAAINGKGTAATTLAAINAQSNIRPDFLAAGYTSVITSYQPWGSSNYNGLLANVKGRIHGLQLNASYTFSKAMDDSTAEVFSTTLTPRRPQNPRDMRSEYSRSALDHTHRLTLEANYKIQPFHDNANWMLKNLVGNWVVSPIYTYESPEYATVLGGSNGLLTGDGAYVGRTIINPNGVKGTGSTVTAITDVNGNTTGYTADNPNAYYIQAGGGAMPNSGRNTMPGRPTNNLDLSAFKRFTAYDHYTIEFGAQAFNALNHAQYLPGSVDDVNAYSYTGLEYVTVGNAAFNHPEKVFSNNPRILQLSAKFLF